MYADYMTKLMAPKPYPPQPSFDPPKLSQLSKPIGECTVGVLTSCGAQRKDDRPMAETNDLSYRLLHRDIHLSELKVSHMTPVRQWALDDLNVAYPRDRLIELEADGVFKKARAQRRFYGWVDHALQRAFERSGAADQGRIRQAEN